MNLNFPLALSAAPAGSAVGTAASTAECATRGSPVAASYRSGILRATGTSLAGDLPEGKCRFDPERSELEPLGWLNGALGRARSEVLRVPGCNKAGRGLRTGRFQCSRAV